MLIWAFILGSNYSESLSVTLFEDTGCELQDPGAQNEANSNTITPRLRDPELGGEVLCFRCGYNLQGVSVRANCPECGLPVRTSILAIVDPRASELVPLTHPRITGAGLICWTVGLCSTYVGIPLAIAWSLDFVHDRSRDPGSFVIWFGAVVSSVGALLLIRPHAATPVRQRVLTAMSAVGFLGSAVCHSAMMPFSYAVSLQDISEFSRPAIPMFMFLALVHSSHAISILLIRAPIRELAARSVLMRSGSVNRQTLAATVAVLSIAALGEMLVVSAYNRLTDDVFAIGGLAFAIAGMMLLMVGGVGLVLDAVRLLPVLLDPPKRLSSIIRSGTTYDR
jgi:hypothetical protein